MWQVRRERGDQTDAETPVRHDTAARSLMKLTFLGTRAYIDVKSRRHRRHSALLVAHDGYRLMVDCGRDWGRRVRRVRPHAVIITHGHPDHVWGLKRGINCPVYATNASWAIIRDYPITDRHTVKAREPFRLGGMRVEAFPVIHSLRAPTVGYRISAGGKAFFYIPDVVDILDRAEALEGVELYIGDGSTITRPLVRRRGDQLFGHTTVRAQLGWCQEGGVTRALFTHCGTEIVAGDERRLRPQLRALAGERGVDAEIAHDGMTIDLPES